MASCAIQAEKKRRVPSKNSDAMNSGPSASNTARAMLDRAIRNIAYTHNAAMRIQMIRLAMKHPKLNIGLATAFDQRIPATLPPRSQITSMVATGSLLPMTAAASCAGAR